MNKGIRYINNLRFKRWKEKCKRKCKQYLGDWYVIIYFAVLCCLLYLGMLQHPPGWFLEISQRVYFFITTSGFSLIPSILVFYVFKGLRESPLTFSPADGPFLFITPVSPKDYITVKLLIAYVKITAIGTAIFLISWPFVSSLALGPVWPYLSTILSFILAFAAGVNISWLVFNAGYKTKKIIKYVFISILVLMTFLLYCLGFYGIHMGHIPLPQQFLLLVSGLIFAVSLTALLLLSNKLNFQELERDSVSKSKAKIYTWLGNAATLKTPVRKFSFLKFSLPGYRPGGSSIVWKNTAQLLKRSIAYYIYKFLIPLAVLIYMVSRFPFLPFQAIFFVLALYFMLSSHAIHDSLLYELNNFDYLQLIPVSTKDITGGYGRGVFIWTVICCLVFIIFIMVIPGFHKYAIISAFLSIPGIASFLTWSSIYNILSDQPGEKYNNSAKGNELVVILLLLALPVLSFYLFSLGISPLLLPFLCTLIYLPLAKVYRKKAIKVLEEMLS
ncbi:MAG TPA: hypothetical protein GXZ32_03470 [Clostridiales bacterium]|nr:hypothetical protein [Clostridiales bacterium]